MLRFGFMHSLVYAGSACCTVSEIPTSVSKKKKKGILLSVDFTKRAKISWAGG